MEESSFIIKFSGTADNKGKQVTVSGAIQTDLVEVFDQRGYQTSKKKGNNTASDDASAMLKYMNPGASTKDVNIRDQYTFSPKIEHEVITSNSEEPIKMNFLLTNEGEYSGMSVNLGDYDVEEGGESLIITDCEEVHIFINSGGMKMRLSQMPGNAQNLPSQDFKKPEGSEIKKTGASKKILGYTCFEYVIKDEGMDARFWVTSDLNLKNWMNFDTDEIEGHVLEYDITSKDVDMKSIATKINAKANIVIKSSEYRQF
jgi:hypothetical protein